MGIIFLFLCVCFFLGKSIRGFKGEKEKTLFFSSCKLEKGKLIAQYGYQDRLRYRYTPNTTRLMAIGFIYTLTAYTVQFYVYYSLTGMQRVYYYPENRIFVLRLLEGLSGAGVGLTPYTPRYYVKRKAPRTSRGYYNGVRCKLFGNCVPIISYFCVQSQFNEIIQIKENCHKAQKILAL